MIGCIEPFKLAMIQNYNDSKLEAPKPGDGCGRTGGGFCDTKLEHAVRPFIWWVPSRWPPRKLSANLLDGAVVLVDGAEPSMFNTRRKISPPI